MTNINWKAGSDSGANKASPDKFEDKADALKDLDHPNCVKCYKIYGNGEPGSTLILNLISGMDLNKAIMKQERW